MSRARGDLIERGSTETVVRFGADLVRAGHLAWAAAELLSGNLASALGLGLTFALLLVPRLLDLPSELDLAFVCGFTLQSLGKFAGLFGSLAWWDTLVHFALPLVTAPALVVLLARHRVLATPEGGLRRAFAAWLLSWLLASGIGAVYEIYEWIADAAFGTTYQPSNADTMTDLTANVVGGAVGGILLATLIAWRGPSWMQRRCRTGAACRGR